MLLSECSVRKLEISFLAILTTVIRISSSFQKVEMMTYNPYVEKCCIALQEASEYPTDQRLVYLIQLQSCVQKIPQTLPTENLEATWGSNTPVVMFVNTLASDIRKLRETLPIYLAQDRKYSICQIVSLTWKVLMDNRNSSLSSLSPRNRFV
jgi:hypothetical protein